MLGLAAPLQGASDGAQAPGPGEAGVQEAAPCVACQTLSVTPVQVSALPGRLAGTRVLIRLAPSAPGGRAAAETGGGRSAEWTPALQELRRRGAVAGLHLTGVPQEDDPVLAADADTLIVEALAGDPDRMAFDLKRAFSLVRGRHPSETVLVAASPDVSAALRERGLASYIDGFVAPAVDIGSPDDLLVPGPHIWRLPDGEAAARAVAAAAADLQAWLPDGLVPVLGRALRCGAERPLRALLNPRTLDLIAVSRSCPAPAIVTSDVPGATTERMDVGPASVFRVRMNDAGRFAEGVDVSAARALTVDEIIARHQAAAARQAAEVVTSIGTGSFTLTFEAPGFVAPITVTSRTTIYEDRRARTARASAASEPRDRSEPAERRARARAGESEGRSPSDGSRPGDRGQTDLRQAEIRVNGVLFTARDGVPRLPIIEPERAAAPPLAITLSDVYRYRLAGRASIDGRDCYVVAFKPRDPESARIAAGPGQGASRAAGARSFYEGRAWIDRATFGMVRVAAAQTGLEGPITASEQTDDFATDTPGRWRLARSDVRQTYEGAAVRTPIHRLIIIERYEVNPPDFDARRAAAYASTDVMLRDTPDGFRYLKVEGRRQKAEGERPGAGGAETVGAAARGELNADSGKLTADGGRVLAGRADRIRTLAFGVIVDPNITQPLPFAGLSYVDFNLFGTGTQFSGFFGGSYGQLAFSVPSVRGTRWQLAGRAFGIASSYNDRAFEQGRELYTFDIRQRPAQAAVWVLRPLSARSALRLEYDWDYTKFGAGEVTDPAFAVPRNQNAHALRVGLDGQRGGWQASVWASYARRAGWRPWGVAASADASAGRAASEYRSGHADYSRYGASLLRSQALSPRVTTRIEGAVMAGSDLDRFSRFAFGTFDNRLRGYPAALVRYDRGAVLRTAVAWSVARVLRLDGFFDTAQVHDPGFGRGLRNYTGFGAAVEAPAPFGTLLAAEWGFGVQGVNASGRRGTHVVRISGYKVF